jgi:hypothetical protein
MYLSHKSYCVSESIMSSFSDAYQSHTLYRTEWQDDMDYELLKDGSGSADGHFQKNYSGICMSGLTKHIQNLRQFTRWDSNPPKYEALIYTTKQLICSMTFKLRVSLYSKHL